MHIDAYFKCIVSYNFRGETISYRIRVVSDTRILFVHHRIYVSKMVGHFQRGAEGALLRVKCIYKS